MLPFSLCCMLPSVHSLGFFALRIKRGNHPHSWSPPEVSEFSRGWRMGLYAMTQDVTKKIARPAVDNCWTQACVLAFCIWWPLTSPSILLSLLHTHGDKYRQLLPFVCRMTGKCDGHKFHERVTRAASQLRNDLFEKHISTASFPPMQTPPALQNSTPNLSVRSEVFARSQPSHKSPENRHPDPKKKKKVSRSTSNHQARQENFQKDKKCQHKSAYFCRSCGGKGICQHGKQRYRCMECGGKGLCRHGRRRRCCPICGEVGRGICCHGRDAYYCKLCVPPGKGICQHMRVRSSCTLCRGGGVCHHLRVRSWCPACRPLAFLACLIRGQVRSALKRYVPDKRTNSGGVDKPSIAAIFSYDTNQPEIATKKKSLATMRAGILLGCDVATLRKHLQEQFTEGMSFDNYGGPSKMMRSQQSALTQADFMVRSEGEAETAINEECQNNWITGRSIAAAEDSNSSSQTRLSVLGRFWHVDHRRPIASFDLSKPQHLRMCFHYSNLCPLWAEDNLQKNAKYDRSTFTHKWLNNNVGWVPKVPRTKTTKTSTSTKNPRVQFFQFIK